MQILHNTQRPKIRWQLITDILLWNKSFKSTTKLRNHHSMIFNFKVHTPPLLNHNNSDSTNSGENMEDIALAPEETHKERPKRNTTQPKYLDNYV